MCENQTLADANFTRGRAFAIVPAAGRSRRMGRPKLLAQWRGQPLIAATIRAWQNSQVDVVVMVVEANNVELIEVSQRLGAELVVPAMPPAEMKDSVRIALAHVQAQFAPTAADVWLLAPADMPELSPAVALRLLDAAAQHPGQIIVPMHDGRRGHPVLFPWSLAAEVATLAAHEGVNALLHRHPCVTLDCGPACLAADIDSPDDLARLQDR
jgi:molybdenum cofactor cytidylyltransferase